MKPEQAAVSLIEPHQTYELRHKILRPHQPVQDSQYPGDEHELTFHLGATLEHQLISVASFYQEDHPKIFGKNQYRLRGMATLEAYRNRKAGSSLITVAEQHLRKRKAPLWWCNARTTVSGYYKRFGMEQLGKPFDIPPIGIHVLMVKSLES